MIAIPETWRKLEKKKESSSGMEAEAKNIEFRMDERKKSVINVGKGGGGIGVGLIFIGGALATAALVTGLTVGRRLRKSNKSKNQNCDGSTDSTRKTDEFIKENDRDESKGCFLPDSSPSIHQNPSNGTEKTDVIETDNQNIAVFTQSFFLDQKTKLETNDEKGDIIKDNKEILFTSCPDEIESNTRNDDPAASNPQKEFSFPVIGDPVLLQLANMTNNLYGGGIEMITEEDNKCEADDGLPTNETVVVLKVDETLVTAHADQCKDITANSMLEEEEQEIWSQFEVTQIETVQLLKRDQTIEDDAAYANHGKGSTVTQNFEDERYERHCELMTIETAQEVEEDTVIEKAQGKDKPEILMIEEEEGAQAPHDAAVESAEVVDGVTSSRDLQKQLIKGQHETPLNSDQEDNSMFVFDGVTSESIPCQDCAPAVPNLSLEAFAISSETKPETGFDNDFKGNFSAEASDIKTENVASKQAGEDRVVEKSGSQPTESTGEYPNDDHGNDSVEVEVTFLTTDVDIVPMDNHPLMGMSEEDIVDDLGDDDDADEAIIVDKVDESSEGTGDSSVESNTEPIWPAESLQELSMELTEHKLNDQKENQQAEEDKTVPTQTQMEVKNVMELVGDITSKSLQKADDGKGNTNMTFLEKYMLEIPEQNDQPRNSVRRRTLILMWTFLGLLWPLCFWYFGLPFLKICLILLLVILLYKI